MSRIVQREISLDDPVAERYYEPHTIDRSFVEPAPFSVHGETVYTEDKLRALDSFSRLCCRADKWAQTDKPLAPKRY